MWISKTEYNDLSARAAILSSRLELAHRSEESIALDLKRERDQRYAWESGRYKVKPGGATLYVDATGDEIFVEAGSFVSSHGEWVTVRDADGGVMATFKFEKSYVVEQNKQENEKA